MSLRSTFRWLTAADERETLSELNAKIAERESAQKQPKRGVVEQRDAVRKTIVLRLGTELVIVGVLIAGTAAKIVSVLSGKPEQGAQPGLVEGGAAKPLENIDFDAPGMMKQFVFINLPKDQKDVDALHDKIGEALKLALQNKEVAETFRTSDIDIILTPNVSTTAQAAVERIGAAGAAGNGVDFRTWAGDAITISTKQRGAADMKHMMIVDEKLVGDPLKLAVAMDHELGHVRERKGGNVLRDVSKEEIDVFTGSIARLRILVQRLRATNGANDPIARRLETEIIPHEEGLLRGWRSMPKKR